MPSLLVQVLPFALTAAISPVLLTLEVVILASAHQPKLRAWFYALGGAIFILGFFFLLLTVLGGLTSTMGQTLAERVIKLVAATALILLGVRQLIPRKTAGENHTSRVQRVIRDGKAWEFALVGLLGMASNFSSLIIVIPALHRITLSDAPSSEQFLATAELFFFVMLPMLLPVLLITLLGKRADPILHVLNAFMTKYTRQITAIVCLAIGALLIYSALK